MGGTGCRRRLIPDLLCLPAAVSRSCWMREPTCFAVLICPVLLRMCCAMNLLRFGKRLRPRGDLLSAGVYFSSPACARREQV